MWNGYNSRRRNPDSRPGTVCRIEPEQMHVGTCLVIQHGRDQGGVRQGREAGEGSVAVAIRAGGSKALGQYRPVRRGRPKFAPAAWSRLPVREVMRLGCTRVRQRRGSRETMRQVLVNSVRRRGRPVVVSENRTVASVQQLSAAAPRSGHPPLPACSPGRATARRAACRCPPVRSRPARACPSWSPHTAGPPA